jgi:hypothetical protein
MKTNSIVLFPLPPIYLLDFGGIFEFSVLKLQFYADLLHHIHTEKSHCAL